MKWILAFLFFIVPASLGAEEVYFGKEHYHPDSPCYMAGKQHYLGLSVISDSRCAPQIAVKQEIKEKEEVSSVNQTNIGIVIHQEQAEEAPQSQWQLSPFRHERPRSRESSPPAPPPPPTGPLIRQGPGFVLDPQTGIVRPVF